MSRPLLALAIGVVSGFGLGFVIAAVAVAYTTRELETRVAGLRGALIRIAKGHRTDPQAVALDALAFDHRIAADQETADALD